VGEEQRACVRAISGCAGDSIARLRPADRRVAAIALGLSLNPVGSRAASNRARIRTRGPAHERSA